MAKRKSTPEKSKIDRGPRLAFSKRHKSSGGSDAKDAADAKVEATPDVKSESKHETKPEAGPAQDATKAEPAKAEPEPAKADKPEEAPKVKDAPAEVVIDPPEAAEPWPDATPQPMRPVEPARGRADTMTMPAEVQVGSPPEVPAAKPAGTVEDPTHMPGPLNIPDGNPDDKALPPGGVPPGDSRSFRKDGEFALVYRVQTCVISRFGAIGTRGQWRVVEYPTSTSASNAYAKECSRFASDGFSDYRE